MKYLLNKQLCRECKHGHEHLEVIICMKFAFKHSVSPIDDNVNQEKLMLNECPYKMEHIILMQEKEDVK